MYIQNENVTHSLQFYQQNKPINKNNVLGTWRVRACVRACVCVCLRARRGVKRGRDMTGETTISNFYCFFTDQYYFYSRCKNKIISHYFFCTHYKM